MSTQGDIVSQDFKEQLQRIVEQLAPEFRLQTQQEIASVLQRGVSSHDDLLKVIQDPIASTDIRCTACWIAGRLGDPQAVTALLVALGDEQLTIRVQAAISLSELQSKESIPCLLSTMLNDPDREVRTAAAYAFGFFDDRDERVVQALISVLDNKRESPAVRGQAAEALGNRGERQAMLPLLAALDDTPVEVRFWATFALGQLGDPKALEALEHIAATDQAILSGWGPVSKEAREAIQSIQDQQNRNDNLRKSQQRDR
ncbi:MAG TPA: HEAT repeat domain-containing protein [Ktedonosporobacter sp.]|nr:HEAT repeat domain-containing protein [Ktedonosporobacter sp.]